MSNKFSEKIEKMTFEQAMQELEKVVSKLESGNESLENAIEEYEYGILLQKFCENKLKEAKLKVEKITKKEDGSLIVEPAILE